MDRMNPPPNYYGAMYPNGNGQMNTPYPPNSNNLVSPPPYTEENAPSYKVANSDTGVQDSSSGNSYIGIEAGVKSVKAFYDEFKSLINERIGTHVKIYCAFTDSSLWHDKVFEGTLIAAADNYMFIKESETNKYTFIAAVYVLYVEFFEK